MNAALLESKSNLERKPLSKFSGSALFLAPQAAFEFFEKRETASRQCPWKQPIGTDASPTSKAIQIESSIPQLLKSLCFSLELMLNDCNPDGNVKNTLPVVKKSIAELLPHLQRVLQRCEKEKNIQKLLPDIQDILRELKNTLASSSSASVATNPAGGTTLTTSQGDSLFSKPAFYYGWGAILHVLETSLAQIQCPAVADFHVCKSSLKTMSQIADDLADWESTMKNISSLEDIPDVLLGLNIVTTQAILLASEIDPILGQLHAESQLLMTSSPPDRETGEKLEKHRKDLIWRLDSILSILEAPLLSYSDTGLLLKKTAQYRRMLVEQQPLGYRPVTDLGTLPETSQKEVRDWLETFCIPLRGIIETLTLSQVTAKEPPQTTTVSCVERAAPPAVEKPVARPRKKHPKSPSHSSQSDFSPAPAPAEIFRKSEQDGAILESKKEEPSVSPSAVHEAPSKGLSGSPVDEEPKKEDSLSDDQDQAAPAADATSAQEQVDQVAPQDSRLSTESHKRKDRDIPRRVENFRKLKQLLNRYGFKQESGGKHLKFVNVAGGKLAVPFHGGKESIARGTSAAIVARAQALSQRLDSKIDQLKTKL